MNFSGNNYFILTKEPARIKAALLNIFIHHQGGNADVTIGTVVIPVIAVQAISVEIAEVEAVTVSAAKYVKHLPNALPLEYSQGCIEFRAVSALVSDTG
jgi:hypothetical protein